jgi:hypothetical protein
MTGNAFAQRLLLLCSNQRKRLKMILGEITVVYDESAEISEQAQKAVALLCEAVELFGSVPESDWRGIDLAIFHAFKAAPKTAQAVAVAASLHRIATLHPDHAADVSCLPGLRFVSGNKAKERVAELIKEGRVSRVPIG